MTVLRRIYYWFRNGLFDDTDDLLDGMCDPALNPEPLADEDIPYEVLFGDVAGDDAAVAERQAKWETLFGAV